MFASPQKSAPAMRLFLPEKATARIALAMTRILPLKYVAHQQNSLPMNADRLFLKS